MTGQMDLAKLIIGLTYGDLRDVAEKLVEMNEDERVMRDVKTTAGMAETLFDWAKSHIETFEDDQP